MGISPPGRKEARPLENITDGSILEDGRAAQSGDELGAKRTDSMGSPTDSLHWVHNRAGPSR